MRLGLTVLLLLIAAPAANAQELEALQDRSANWGAIGKCSTQIDDAGEVIETCRTLRYCRMSYRLERGERILRIGRCARQAPWTIPARRSA